VFAAGVSVRGMKAPAQNKLVRAVPLGLIAAAAIAGTASAGTASAGTASAGTAAPLAAPPAVPLATYADRYAALAVARQRLADTH
jgi:hypothetical protein